MDMLPRIERHLERTGMPVTLFGRLVARDPRLVLDMRRGRQPGPQMRGRIEAFITARGND